MKKLFDWVVGVTLSNGGHKVFTFPSKAAAEKFAERTRAEGYEAVVKRRKT